MVRPPARPVGAAGRRDAPCPGLSCGRPRVVSRRTGSGCCSAVPTAERVESFDSGRRCEPCCPDFTRSGELFGSRTRTSNGTILLGAPAADRSLSTRLTSPSKASRRLSPAVGLHHRAGSAAVCVLGQRVRRHSGLTLTAPEHAPGRGLAPGGPFRPGALTRPGPLRATRAGERRRDRKRTPERVRGRPGAMSSGTPPHRRALWPRAVRRRAAPPPCGPPRPPPPRRAPRRSPRRSACGPGRGSAACTRGTCGPRRAVRR